MKLHTLGALTLTALLIGCSSASKKADYSNNADVKDQIAQLESGIENAEASQYDVVAPKELQRSQHHLDEAKRELQHGDKLSSINDDLAESRAALAKAKDQFDRRKDKIADVLRARQAALDAGAHRYARSEKELAALDDSFRHNAAGLDKVRDPEIWDRAVKDYKIPEILAVQENQVGDARERIEMARRQGARYLAPKTLKDAQKALADADKAIARDTHDEAAYNDQVNAAKKAAATLVAVTAEARKASLESNEHVARDLVEQKSVNRSLRGELKGSQLESDLKGQALVDKDQQLRGVAATEGALAQDKKFNDSLNQAREQFNPDEADVYREGDKLLIRLKSMDFRPGQSDLPAHALPVLAKVKEVIKDLNAQDVVVQGHTDSRGSAKVNKTLSQGRAEAVADYLKQDTDASFEAVGYGYRNPIDSNRTKQGRAANRRVDVVITPSSQAM